MRSEENYEFLLTFRILNWSLFKTLDFILETIQKPLRNFNKSCHKYLTLRSSKTVIQKLCVAKKIYYAAKAINFLFKLSNFLFSTRIFLELKNRGKNHHFGP